MIFNNGEVQTADLTWTADKPYFVATETDAQGHYKGTWYAKTDVPAAPEPTPGVADGFYLMGTMNGWQPAEGYLFMANESQAGEYYLGVTLAVEDELKVAKVQNGAAVTWYPAEGANFVVSAAYAGAKLIYFREEYNADWADFGGYIYIAADVAEGITNSAVESKAVKVLIGNQLLIIRNGKTYNANGMLIR